MEEKGRILGERDTDMRRTRPIVAGIENGGRQPWIKEGSRETIDSKKMGIWFYNFNELQSSNKPKWVENRWSPEMDAACPHLDLSLVRPLLDFWATKL